MKSIFRIVALLSLLSVCAFGTVNVSGSIKDPSGTVVPNSFVRFELTNTNNGQCSVSGASIGKRTADFTANATTGAVSGTLYRNDTEVSCAGSFNTRYNMTIFRKGVPDGPSKCVNITADFDISNPQYCVTPPPVANPAQYVTTTANNSFSGNNAFNGNNSHSGTETFFGTTILGTGLPRLNAAIAKVKKGTGFARVMFIGDSTTFGSQDGATSVPSASYPVDVCNDLAKYNGIRCVSSTWIGAGISTATGNNFGTGDPARISMGSGWSQDAALATIGGHPYTQSASGGAFTFTPTVAVDTFEVYYIQQPSGGVMSVSIDGGTATLVNTAGTASMQKVTLTAASPGTHTISHSWSSGGKVDLVGNIAYDSTTPSVIAILAGAPSANAAQLADQSAAYGGGQSAAYSLLNLDAAVVEDGINDWIQGVSIPSFTTSMTNIVTSILAAGSDLAVFTPVPSNPGVSSAPAYSVQKTYVDALRSIAYAHTNTNGAGIPIVDNNVMWGTYASSIAWYSGDGGIHPSATGYQVNAAAVEGALLSTPAQTHNFNPAPFLSSLPASALALKKTLATSGAYTVTASDGIVYVNGGNAITIPAGLPDGFQVEIFNFDSTLTSTITIGSGATGHGIPSSLAPLTSIVVNITSGAGVWLVGGTFGGSSGTPKTLVTSGTYTVTGSEKQIYVSGGATIALPAGVPEPSQMTIYNFDASLAAVISCSATTCAVPTSLPARTGIVAGTTGGTAWWAQINPVFNSTPSIVTGSFAGEVTLALQGLIGSTGDSFQRADSATTLGTSASGQAWTNGLGIIGISTKQAYLPSATNSKAFYNSGLADGRFLTSFAVIGTTTMTMFRYSDTSNYWAFGVNSSTYRLRKVVAGAQTDVFTSSGITPAANDRLEVIAVGSSISFYLNGTLLATTTDSFNSTATNVGLWSADTTSRWALVAAVKP